MDLVLDHGRVEPDLLTKYPGLQARIAAEPWLKWKTRNVTKHKATVPHSSRQPSVAGADARPAERPYLEVRAADNAWGWEVVLQHPGSSEPLTGGPL